MNGLRGLKVSNEASERLNAIGQASGIVISRIQCMRDCGNGHYDDESIYDECEKRITALGFGFNGLDVYVV